MTASLRDVALKIHSLGANVVAIGDEGDWKKPIFSWTEWKEKRQEQGDVLSQPWAGYRRQRDGLEIATIGCALVDGPGGWHHFDLDKCPDFEPVVRILDALGLPRTYPWVVRTGSGNGWNLAFLCPDSLPAGALSNKEGNQGVPSGPSRDGSFDHLELRWGPCLTKIPPSKHATGPGYIWVNDEPDAPPATVTVSQVLDAFLSVADIPLPAARPERKPTPPGSSSGVTDEIRARFDLVAYAQQHFPGDLEEQGRETRIHGHGGLLIKPDDGKWYCHVDQVGGDAIDLVGYKLYGARWDHSDRLMYPEALRQAADFAGVLLPDWRNTNSPRPAQKKGGQPGHDLEEMNEPAPAADDLPIIVTTNRPLPEITTKTLDALYAANVQALGARYLADGPSPLFVRSGVLARVCTDEKGRPILENVSEAIMRGRMARAADYNKLTPNGPRHTHPPDVAV